LRLDASFPAGVFGPEERAAFCLLANTCAAELILFSYSQIISGVQMQGLQKTRRII
jgi:hypothetical protein